MYSATPNAHNPQLTTHTPHLSINSSPRLLLLFDVSTNDIWKLSKASLLQPTMDPSSASTSISTSTLPSSCTQSFSLLPRMFPPASKFGKFAPPFPQSHARMLEVRHRHLTIDILSWQPPAQYPNRAGTHSDLLVADQYRAEIREKSTGIDHGILQTLRNMLQLAIF